MVINIMYIIVVALRVYGKDAPWVNARVTEHLYGYRKRDAARNKALDASA